ncbi:hypothetical protein N7466_011381 [Penicillium verhagenii]|uniref:uncharacterized protein n=1 Tax=Penicillium verhagenii TaxID=1562060 RepID=UPI00254504C8|nr:uncharacterized protein N7466_011381 [Penicillium verhagenii]KAJ5915448.1 hypothetical protein N7466_011381 [Penicillium verhagenii]
MGSLPELRWGIVATGMIASWFVTDLSLPRPDRRANHTIQAVGSSTKAKAQKFVETHIPPPAQSAVTCYGSYSAIYTDPNVDIVYIATPHALHKQNCLDAIHAGKHVLCEKPFALNAREAATIIAAAREKGVFVMEGLWTRFFPLVEKVRDLLHGEKIIGEISRVFADFSLDMPLQDLPATSRLRDARLGAGSLLDIGVYALTWGLLCLESPGDASRRPRITASQRLLEGVDVGSAVLLYYPDTGRQGVLTSSLLHKTDDIFARVEGSKGTLYLGGDTASMPDRIVVSLKPVGAGNDMGDKKAGSDGVRGSERTFRFEETCGGKGFYYEADAIALDLAAGKTESEIMPLDETLRVMRLLDEIRAQGGARFPQDDE